MKQKRKKGVVRFVWTRCCLLLTAGQDNSIQHFIPEYIYVCTSFLKINMGEKIGDFTVRKSFHEIGAINVFVSDL